MIIIFQTDEYIYTICKIETSSIVLQLKFTSISRNKNCTTYVSQILRLQATRLFFTEKRLYN